MKEKGRKEKGRKVEGRKVKGRKKEREGGSMPSTCVLPLWLRGVPCSRWRAPPAPAASPAPPHTHTGTPDGGGGGGGGIGSGGHEWTGQEERRWRRSFLHFTSLYTHTDIHTHSDSRRWGMWMRLWWGGVDCGWERGIVWCEDVRMILRNGMRCESIQRILRSNG